MQVLAARTASRGNFHIRGFRREIVVDETEVVFHLWRAVKNVAEVVPENLLGFQRQGINLDQKPAISSLKVNSN
jgi:hypothetical protein